MKQLEKLLKRPNWFDNWAHFSSSHFQSHSIMFQIWVKSSSSFSSLYFYCPSLFHDDDDCDDGCEADQHSIVQWVVHANEKIASWEGSRLVTRYSKTELCEKWHKKCRLKSYVSDGLMRMWFMLNCSCSRTVLIIKIFLFAVVFRSSFDVNLIASFQACKICCDRHVRGKVRQVGDKKAVHLGAIIAAWNILLT